jgi:DNA polymerase-3 subunit beta
LIEGAYPKYADVIPADLDKEISIDREAFFSAVRRCAVMTTDEYKLLEFTFEDNLLQLICTSPDVGESNVDVSIEYDGEKVAIGLNPDYVNDLSKAIDTETVTLELKDSKTACIFTEGNSYTYVLMPMAIAHA